MRLGSAMVAQCAGNRIFGVSQVFPMDGAKFPEDELSELSSQGAVDAVIPRVRTWRIRLCCVFRKGMVHDAHGPALRVSGGGNPLDAASLCSDDGG